jgi:hypothetical protein
VVLVGWQHPFYTSFVGIGLATARLNRNLWVKLLAPALGLGLAILTHSLHNTLATLADEVVGLICGTLIDWSGWFLMFLVILWAIRDVHKRIRAQLREEALNGVISARQYHTACSSWAQAWARTTALFEGRYRNTARFYQLCGELAHKKHQYAQLGDERGNLKIITETRAELARLAPKVKG